MGRNGQAKGGPKAVCTLCSACEDYSSGWCADNCAQYGEATVAESHTVKAFRSCLAGSVVPKRCVKQHRRLEDEEERELSHESAPLHKFDADCREKLTKRNGQAKGGPKAVCTLCSACEDYSSGWCADNCAQYGEAT